ncbi:MAG: hypothetical protein WC750_00485 [Patescibacteria group bacterium]|jgi:cysteine-rich repeat protein
MKLRKWLGVLALSILCLAGAGFALPAKAQLNTGLNEVGQTIKLSGEDPRIIAGRIINVVLGVLGIILLALMLYAGFLWMTSGGDAEKIKKAQGIIRNAIIGLVIILSAWAITYYIINVLLNATGGGGGGGGGGAGGGGGGGGFGGGGSKAFRIASAAPQGDDKNPYNTNSKVNITFTQEISSDISKDWAKYVQVTAQNNVVNGIWEVVGNGAQWIRFTPGENCPEDPNQKCFSKNTLFSVVVNKGTFVSASKELINCGGLYPACTFSFYIGDKIDKQAPAVTITGLYDYQSFCEDVPYVSVPAKAVDDFGVSVMQWLEDDVLWDSDGPSGQPTPKEFSSAKDWSSVGKILKQPYAITVKATDLDSNTGAQTIHLSVLKNHCCNKKQDGDETGLDCGGQDCLSCGGGLCSGNGQCASGLCENGVCVERPIITNVSPTSGKDGTFVSIWGGNFGESGTTTFMGPPAVEAVAPQACVALGVKAWNDNYILVEVPKGAQTGPIKVYNNKSKLSDTTDKEPGPILPDFVVNSVERPGICKIDPGAGKAGIKATLTGTGFGNAQNNRVIGFGATTQIQQAQWGNSSISFTVPNLYAGWFMVGLKSSNGDPLSNAVPFNLQGEPVQVAPTISALTPDHGPTSQYMTIIGQHFGAVQGLVKFVDKATGSEITGDANFPADCGSGWWSDTQITIKVPNMIDQQGKQIQPLNTGSAPNFKVYILRSQDNKQSNQVDFLFSNEALGPGICRITPTAGPKKTVVQIYGERFGASKGAGDQVVFANNAAADTYNTWESQRIDVVVPDAAVTGKIFIRPSVPPASNEVQFLVGDCRDIPEVCSAKQICCPGGSCADDKCPSTSFQAMYGWEMTTGITPRSPSVVQNCKLSPQPGDLVPPSPSPWENWPGGENVCIGQAKMGVLFDMPIVGTAAELQGKFKLMQCVGKDTDPCQGNQARVEVPVTGFSKQTNHLNGNIKCSQPPDSPDCLDYVTFEPVSDLVKGGIYEVYVASDIKSEGQYGDTMTENKACAEPGSAYCYRFKARNDDTTCEVGYVYMSPYLMAVDGKSTLEYTAQPVAKDATCSLLNCRGFDWEWSVTWKNLPTIYASLLPLKVETYQGQTHVACIQTVQTGSQETPDEPVHVNAQEKLSTISGYGELYIKNLIPQVIDHSPDCQTACLNAYLWARFNTSLNPSTVSAKTVQVFECKNENCLESDLIGQPNLSETYNFQIKLWPEKGNVESNLLSTSFGTSTVSTNSFIMVDPRDYSKNPNDPNAPLVLKEDTFYFVRLLGGVPGSIGSQYGTPMSQNFTWKFRTASGEKAYCTPDHIFVYPSNVIEKRLGDRELFQAKVLSAPDECRADGQMLLVTNNFIWSFVDANQKVAHYAPFPPPKYIDADGALPKGCSSRCLATGSDGVYGQTAKCGNGIVETTDSDYCKSQTLLTLAGQACKFMPISSGAGEQCDGDSNDPLAAKCNKNTCLWMDTPTIGNSGTCGNFLIDSTKGEMCDPGLRCFDTTQGTVTSGTPCDSPGQIGNVTTAACQAAGGKCEIKSYNGCSTGCKNLGASSFPGSECGNGNLGYGEDCDQGSNNGTGGCSTDCLHKGSSNNIGSLCGNEILETGETCEAPSGQALPAWCDHAKCLSLGNSDFEVAVPVDPKDGKCGNGTIDAQNGEECDDGNHINGDGCSSVCLNEGSSWKYPLGGASLCGNGIIEKGETCEVGNNKGNGLLDPMQIGEILGIGTMDPQTKIKQTQLSVKYLTVEAQATFGVKCGNTAETDCGDNHQLSFDYGLDKDGCCSNRPKRIDIFPKNASTNICRNTLISVKFDRPMDAAAVQNNFIVAKELSVVACPEGTTQLKLADNTSEAKGLWPWIKHQWQALIGWINGKSAYAGVWCANMVAGQLTSSSSTKDFYYTLEEALDPNTRYVVRLTGDDNLSDNEDLSKRYGIKSQDGVVVIQDKIADPNAPSGALTWWFQTGNDICRINGVLVEDLDPDHPTYFQKANEKHAFRATAMSLHNGLVEMISPVKQYNWHWWGWVSNNPPVADIVGNDFTVVGAIAEASVAAKEINGSAIIYAGLEVTSDMIDGTEKISQTQIIMGALPIMVFVCDNPWPELTKAPFRDMKDSPTLAKTIFEQGPFFNFQTMYCRDNANGLLPELEAHPIPYATIDQMQGILRQYLFTFKDPVFKHDGIGIRVMSNLYHDTLDKWYARQGFTGTPAKIKIDGYEALRDEGTVYVGFANTEQAGKNIYQNILVISHNLDAMAETTKVFDQLVASLAFNINFSDDNINLCTNNGKPVSYAGENKKSASGIDLVKGKPISCVADWDCVTTSDQSKYCASYKFKLQRDLLRLNDFSNFKAALKSYYTQKGYYPQLSEGTFLYGRTNSRWPSWAETLGKTLGLNDQIPIDPVNRYISCGFCVKSDQTQTSWPCTTVSDCPDNSYTCQANKDGFDPQTCWNVAQKQFLCPALKNNPPSNFYIYRAYEGGRRFELGANFEVPPPNANDLKNWWYPEYQSSIKVCYTTSTISDGSLCQTDDDCKACANPYDPNTCKIAKGPAGSCRVLGDFLYKNICDGNAYGEGGVCGDKVIGDVCYGGGKNGQACKLPADCPNGQCKPELCELGQTHPATCTLAGGKSGTKLQVCNACMGWTDDPKITVCHENAFCGNGRIDKVCDAGDLGGLTCSVNDDCKDGAGAHNCIFAQVGTPPHAEACDDGVLNGTYGHCNTTCSGIDKFCGNSKIDPGEKCDRGSGAGGNGAWCGNPIDCYFYINDPSLKDITYSQSCGLDCQVKAPYCGDGQVFPDPALEECDGNVLTTSGKLCVSLPVNDPDKWEKPCQISSDCGSNVLATCGGDVAHQSCENIKIGRCTTAAKVCVVQIKNFFLKSWFNTAHTYMLCNSNNDCATGQLCMALAHAGGDEGGCTSNGQCQAGNVPGECNQYDTAHVRLCNKPGTSSQCKYEAKWSACKPQHSCGDGVVDAGSCMGGANNGQACKNDAECAGGYCSGEECDDGTNNADFNSCTSLCKKNVCGDGNLNLNVEECDKGTDNGKQTCKAEYQSTCNDCSLQCKNLTASGGYCGNSIKDSNEQCDGNDTIPGKLRAPSAMSSPFYITPHYILQSDLTDNWGQSEAKVYVGNLNPLKDLVKIIKPDVGSLNCQALGYDFAIDSLANAALYVNDPLITLDNTSKGLFNNYWGSEANAVHQQIIQNPSKPPRVLDLVKATNAPINKYQDNALLNTIFDVCGLIRKEKADDDIYDFYWIDPSAWPTRQEFWTCVSTFGSKFGFQAVGDANDKPSCGLDCNIGGCGRCIEQAGVTKINGKLHSSDTLSDNNIGPIEGARVTLQYNNLNITQTFTDKDGYFEFNNLNNRSECSNYRLVFEKFNYESKLIYGQNGENAMVCNCGYVTNASGNFTAANFVNNTTFFISLDESKCNNNNPSNPLPNCKIVKTSSLPQ